MKEDQIRQLQRQYQCDQLQRMIDQGSVWHFEGSMGRSAMDALERGVCFLPDKECFDFWGKRIPPRTELQPGTKGTLENSSKYWLKVVN